jgi:hypothetical protein
LNRFRIVARVLHDSPQNPEVYGKGSKQHATA